MEHLDGNCMISMVRMMIKGPLVTSCLLSFLWVGAKNGFYWWSS